MALSLSNGSLTQAQAALRAPELVAECLNPDCGAETPLSPGFFKGRYDPNISLNVLARHVVCAACGSKVELFPDLGL